ncbi:MAG TPA: DNA polymerase Y family protein [Steroidobacteraceae bacterium]|nr:DNA polymerase Y family protein [Steroidobacteraceae bacterium]
MLWLCIRLPALLRDTQAASERAALERLAAWAYQWSSHVSYRLSSAAEAAAAAAAAAPAAAAPLTGASTPPLLWLELGASRALFGEPAILLERIERELAQLGYSHSCAIAPSPTAAALLTHAEQPDGDAAGRCALTCDELRSRLTPLPLTWLELPAETLQALRSAGLTRIGEVLALPRAALARRFGPQSGHYLARLTAQASDPRPAFRLPESYRAHCEFDHELQQSSALLFPLQRLLQEFQGYLRARDCSVQHFALELGHHPRAAPPKTAAPLTAAAPVTHVAFGLSAPAREAERFLLLVRERLQSLALAAPVRSLTLTADAFTAPSIVQGDLFGGGAQRLGELSQLLDRLRARLGTQAVQGFHCRADHRPEHAFALVPPEQTRPEREQRAAHTPRGGTTRAVAAACAASSALSPAARPAALLPQPRRIEAPRALLAGPERIESGWWDGAGVVRDYYVARAADGARLWMFHDLADDAWYLQGLWV